MGRMGAKTLIWSVAVKRAEPEGKVILDFPNPNNGPELWAITKKQDCNTSS